MTSALTELFGIWDDVSLSINRADAMRNGITFWKRKELYF